MRIDELSLPSSITKAKIILRKAGYKVLGIGSFGTVLKNPKSNYVLKLFKSKDTAYLAFINMVKNNPNRHFPKIIGNIIKVTDQYSAVRLNH